MVSNLNSDLSLVSVISAVQSNTTSWFLQNLSNLVSNCLRELTSTTWYGKLFHISMTLLHLVAGESTASLSIWWIVCSQCSMQLQDWCITVVNTTAFHFTTSARLALAARPWTHQVSSGRSCVPLSQQDCTELPGERPTVGRHGRLAETTAIGDNSEAALASHTTTNDWRPLLHRASGTTCMPTLFLHRHWLFSSGAWRLICLDNHSADNWSCYLSLKLCLRQDKYCR